MSAELAAFMADSQVPWGVDALGGTISEPAWRSKPSWYLVTTEDRMIPPPAQRAMSERAGSTVVEVAGSHAIYVSQPAAVAELIETAVNERPRSGSAPSVFGSTHYRSGGRCPPTVWLPTQPKHRT